MQYAVVFFRQSGKAGVVPRADVEGEFKVQATVKARWEGRMQSAKIIFIGSKRLCESKMGHLTAAGQLIDDDIDVGSLEEDSPSRSISNTPSHRGVNEYLERLREEIMSKLDEIENRMPSRSFGIDMLSEMRALREEVAKLEEMLREVLRRVPPVPEDGTETLRRN
ncbi:hypothetical protein ANCCAN_02417 [Ancylostoma caninum]|uniref:Uncharacterized protein n=1 Tax=Ancylostoma caninum TaxID=29170 RepID=A0A368H4E2_ANCCA|nr:hypothetical protein ANCCAN_02417 [Ancylostoma caninum]